MTERHTDFPRLRTAPATGSGSKPGPALGEIPAGHFRRQLRQYRASQCGGASDVGALEERETGELESLLS